MNPRIPGRPTARRRGTRRRQSLGRGRASACLSRGRRPPPASARAGRGGAGAGRDSQPPRARSRRRGRGSRPRRRRAAAQGRGDANGRRRRAPESAGREGRSPSSSTMRRSLMPTPHRLPPKPRADGRRGADRRDAWPRVARTAGARRRLQAPASLRTAKRPAAGQGDRAQANVAEARVQQAERRARAGEAESRIHRGEGAAAGMVSRSTVEIGQIVQPGQPLLALVPLDKVWVTANFKETQLRDMRPGQGVESTWMRWAAAHSTGTSTASPPRPARASACCRPRTRPATTSRSSSACR